MGKVKDVLLSKTALCAYGIGLVTTLYAMGFMTDDQARIFYGLLNGGGLLALRNAVEKSGPA